MSCCPDYRKATNAAYQLLAAKCIFSLSTNVFSIVEEHSKICKLLTYGQACYLYGYDLEDLVDVSEYGFSIVKKDCRKRIILYNESARLACVRFTIAHVIGHAILGHTDEHSFAAEKEANCFARNLLCPIPVIHDLGLGSVSDYVSVFDVSKKMAGVSFEWQSADTNNIAGDLFTVISDKLHAYLEAFSDIAICIIDILHRRLDKGYSLHKMQKAGCLWVYSGCFQKAQRLEPLI